MNEIRVKKKFRHFRHFSAIFGVFDVFRGQIFFFFGADYLFIYLFNPPEILGGCSLPKSIGAQLKAKSLDDFSQNHAILKKKNNRPRGNVRKSTTGPQ